MATCRWRVGTADQFNVGRIARTDFTLFVNNADDGNVLGMNFLSVAQQLAGRGQHVDPSPMTNDIQLGGVYIC